MRFRTAKPEFKLIVKKCRIEGKGVGVFTESAIPKGAFVCELAGRFLSYKQWRKTAPSEFIFCFSLKNVSFFAQYIYEMFMQSLNSLILAVDQQLRRCQANIHVH
jgi:hypothetical protein